MKLFVVAALLLSSAQVLACDLTLVSPAKSALKKPVAVRASLAGDILTAGFSVSSPLLHAKKVLGPGQNPYMFDVVELFADVFGNGFPYLNLRGIAVQPIRLFQVRIASFVPGTRRVSISAWHRRRRCEPAAGARI